MKKGLKIFLIILSAVIVVGGTVAVWQWDNITSFVYFMCYSTEDLENLEEKNKEELATAVAGLDAVPRDLTDEEKEALANGEITKQEAVELSLGIKKQDSQKSCAVGHRYKPKQIGQNFRACGGTLCAEIIILIQA